MATGLVRSDSMRRAKRSAWAGAIVRQFGIDHGVHSESFVVSGAWRPAFGNHGINMGVVRWYSR